MTVNANIPLKKVISHFYGQLRHICVSQTFKSLDFFSILEKMISFILRHHEHEAEIIEGKSSSVLKAGTKTSFVLHCW